MKNSDSGNLKTSLLNKSHFLIDNTFIELKTLKIYESRLFIDGIAFIHGVSVKDFSEIDYKLVLNGKTEYILQLAKSRSPELTELFSNSENVYYDTCWFTTFNYKGIDLSNIPDGDYELSLLISCGGLTVCQKIRANIDTDIDDRNFKFELLEFNKIVVIEGVSIGAKNSSSPMIKTRAHSSEKQQILGGFLDKNGNKLICESKVDKCFIKINGKNNLIEIHREANLKNTFIEVIGDNNKVIIGEKVGFFGNIRLGHNCEVVIGDNVSSTNSVYLTCAENTKVLIGSDCMFATNNQIRTDDAHAIYDVNSGKRVNYSKDIIIGSHVWIGYGATLFGGANIGSSSVVGAFSLVNKSFPNNCVIAGVPAKIVRKDIFWERSPLLLRSKEVASFSKSEMEEKSHCKHTID